jgi:hypothetical protein
MGFVVKSLFDRNYLAGCFWFKFLFDLYYNNDCRKAEETINILGGLLCQLCLIKSNSGTDTSIQYSKEERWKPKKR